MKVIAFDVGGTNIEFGVIEDGKILKKGETSAKGIQNQESFVSILKNIINAATGEKEIDAISMGIAGLVNPDTGEILFSPNLPYLNGLNLRKALKEVADFFIDNDANVYALGEWQFGAGLKKDNVVVLTLGTGVGAGIIANGRLLRGANYYAGEAGHIVIDFEGQVCKCGQRGCVESYIGGDYFPEFAKYYYRRESRSLCEKCTMLELARRAKKGDRKALYLFEVYGKYLALGLVNIIHLLDPEIVVLGGGISESFELFKEAMFKELERRVMGFSRRNLKITKGILGKEAGIFGGFVLAKNKV